jgi:hypothetical protein
MNREDIIRMAQEAQMPFYWRTGEITYLDKLERFAALVASAEREAIAQMIDNAPALVEYVTNDQGGCLVCGFTPKLAAKTIRARGQA